MPDAAMQTFLRYMHKASAPTDYFWALVNAVVTAGNLLVNKAAMNDSSSPQQQPQYQAWNFSISAASLLVAVAISLNRSVYLRKRTVLLVLAKLLGFLTLGTLLQPYIALLPRVMAQEATTPPATMLMQLAMISEKGALLFLSATGWQLPLRAHLAVQVVGLLCMLSTLPQQCAEQCAHAAYRTMYASWASWLSAACGHAFPVTIASRRDAPSSFPCLAVNAWAQLVLGYAAPALYLHWAQSALRRRFLLETGQARGEPANGPWMSGALHVAMAAVALPVSWRAVEVVVPLWQAAQAAVAGAGVVPPAAGQALLQQIVPLA